MRTIILFLGFAVAGCAACIPISSPTIFAGDLAHVIPAFGLIDPATSIGYAPLFGTNRIVRAKDLAGLLQRNGVDVGSVAPIEDLCVVRSTQPLSPDAIREALAKGLGIPDAEIDLIDYSKQAFPPGSLVFDRRNLPRPPENAPDLPVIWRGKLMYDEQRSGCVWARVRISVRRSAWVASENIRSGVPVQPTQIELTSVRRFPSTAFVSEADQIIGKISRRSIAAGQPLTASLLSSPPEIQRGEKVRVRVTEGSAGLTVEAIAQSSGSKGEAIVVQNPITHRNFRAVISDHGEIVVTPFQGSAR